MSETYMTPGSPAEKMTKERTPEVVGAEVRNLTAAARYLTVWYAVEIGRRLTEAKEMVAHGEWLDWLKRETEFSQPTASRLMRIYAEYGADQGNLFGAETKYSTLNNLSVSNALKLLAVPEEERESFAAEVDAEHLSTRELEQAIRERDELKQALQATTEELAEAQKLSDEETKRAEAAEAKAKELERAVEDAGPYRERAEAAEEEIAGLKSQLKELKEKPIDVAVQEPDPAEIERRASEIAREAGEEAEKQIARLQADKAAAEAQVKAAEEKAKTERDKLREKLKAAEDKLAAAGAEDKAAAERLRGEVESLKKQLAMSDAALVAFKLRFQLWQEAYITVLGALGDLPKENQEKCKGAISAQLDNWKGAL